MSDSVDRVFVHALNTVKRIPRMGTTRPPPSDRLKLYGLYKQSMEGDVDGVLDRPRGDGDDVRSDQEKWDAWNRMKGLSRTEAKRKYISTLIDTMHQYASNTPDARELVSELEFVWDQIRSNPPSSSSSQTYNHNVASAISHGSGPSSSQPIYPVMSEHGARHPGAGRLKRDREMRLLSPASEGNDVMDYEEEEDFMDKGGFEDHAREEFVDAPDSQVGLEEEMSPLESSAMSDEQLAMATLPRERDKKRMTMGVAAEAAANLMAPIANYIRTQTTQYANATQTRTTTAVDEKWHRRIETALIKMNTEMVALREQIEMMQENDNHSSILRPFRRSSFSKQKKTPFEWLLEKFWDAGVVIFKHALVDIALLAVFTLWLRYRGIPQEQVERMVYGWIRKIQQITFVQRLERIGQKTVRSVPAAARLPRSWVSSPSTGRRQATMP